MPTHPPDNATLAASLERIADLLEAEDANPFRVRAYRAGAATVREADHPLADDVRQGDRAALEALPDIGAGLAGLIEEYVTTGELSLLQDLEAQTSPEATLTRVPGIGATLAQRIVAQLGVHTLAGLEEAAHDGRLAEVEGFGPRRIAGVRAALAGMLSPAARRRQSTRTTASPAPPSVNVLLTVDAAYRQRAAAGELHKIAPRRFNPTGEAWLPILHMQQNGWDFTALYSNTAQAHRLDKTDDWVVIYYEKDGQSGQHTVVTETQGPLTGRRVVRGRSAATRQYYQARR